MANTRNNGSTAGLYPYQERDLNILFDKIAHLANGDKILYQLPTGGGKTRIFSEIVRWYVTNYQRQAVVLTHRTELCRQTSNTLKNLGIANKIINSTVTRIAGKQPCDCYVAMVETLRNRLREGVFDASPVGLVIIDEAHYNAFRKLLDKFPDAIVIGVTATPLSSNAALPMNKTYQELVVGESIANLVDEGYLAKPTTWRYDVELNSLQTGIHGDFTIGSSDALYSSPAMQELLLHAYQSHSKNKKTLIFNNGIFTSRNVCKLFEDAGYPVMHLDNRHTSEERDTILQWFRKTKGAILTSVSILTTGFDEPTVQTVILNRATTSLTLYHQMIGRGARSLPNKKTFAIVDLGDNVERFGAWQSPLDWHLVFERPEAYIQSVQHLRTTEAHAVPPELHAKFPNSLQLTFDVQGAYQQALDAGRKPITVMMDAIRQHATICIENSNSIAGAETLADELDHEILWRVKQYGKCLGKVTKNYLEWLVTDYKSRLKVLIQQLMQRNMRQESRKQKVA